MSGETFIDDLVAATKRHGVTCVVLAGNGAAHVDDDDGDDATEVVAPFVQLPVDPSEVEKLRSQVQKLSAELQAAQQRPATSTATSTVTTGVQVPAGDHGNVDGLSTEVLGFSEDALTKKLMRTGFETVGKLRAAFMAGTLASDELKLKKDWLIEVGMKLAGAGPSSAAPVAVSASAITSDVPSGHADRPWLERLAVAREKQKQLNECRAKLAEKLAEAAKYSKAKKEIPTELDDEVVGIEDSISTYEAQMVVIRWTMNLDTDKTLSLDDALARANLGPWMSNPQPRLAPQ